jgi:signal transduction histidine kinase
MQAPQSSTAGKKHGSPESQPSQPPQQSQPLQQSKHPQPPTGSFFAELAAAAAAGNAALHAASKAAASEKPVSDTSRASGPAARPQTEAALTGVKPFAAPKPRSRAAEPTDAPIPSETKETSETKEAKETKETKEAKQARETKETRLPDPVRDRAKVSAHITDRRSASRRADDPPASNRPDREWIRPGWMTQDRDALAQSLRGLPQERAQAERRPAAPGAAQPEGKPLASSAPAAPKERGAGAAGLAHDAGNLLAALMLYSELLSLPGVLPERYRHYADDLMLLAERSRTLIDRLVSFGGAVDHERAITQGDGSLSLVDVLVRCEGLLSTLTRGSLQVTFGAQAALPVAIAPEPLERILVNLVKNAACATRNGGSVRIGVGLCAAEAGEASAALVSLPAATRLPLAPPRYRSAVRNLSRAGGAATTDTTGASGKKQSPRGTARRMMLTVDDSGCGMSEAEVARLMHPEAGGTAEALPASGTHDSSQRQGVGLRVVRELVAASGGSLTIESRVGVGTHIEIQWPVAEAERSERSDQSQRSEQSEQSGQSGQSGQSQQSGQSRPIGSSSSLEAVSRSVRSSSPGSPAKSKLKAELAAPLPGILPRIEMVADPLELVPLGSFAEIAGFEGGLSEAERRLLTEQTNRDERRTVSGSTDFKRFTTDSKGAIAC